MAKKIRIPFGNDLPISFKLAVKNLDGTITPISTSDVQNLVVKYGSSSPAQATQIDYTSDENYIYIFIDSTILKRGSIYSFFISGYRNGLDFSLNFVNVIEVVTDNDDANYLDFVIDMAHVEYGGFFIGLKNYDETIRPYIEDAERATANADSSAENANISAANANASAEYAKQQGDKLGDASASADRAESARESASEYAENAMVYAERANASAENANASAYSASDNATKSATSALEASQSADRAESAAKDITDSSAMIEKNHADILYIESQIKKTPYESETENMDFGICDEYGNVVVKLANGNIETKKFNSQKTAESNNSPSDLSDFSIVDEKGNAVISVVDGHIVTKNFNSSTIGAKDDYSTQECVNAFIEKMNQYASEFGMTNTHFLNASGMHQDGHYSCANDIVRLTACCTAYEKLMRYWGMESYSVNVYGEHARVVSGVSTYKGASMQSVGNYYHIFGGKSGSWTINGVSNRNLTLAVKSKVDDSWLIGCIIKSETSDRGIPFKQLIDWLESYRTDSNVSTPTINATYAAAAVLPNGNPMSYSDMNIINVNKNGDTRYFPFSMTKLMTAIVVLDYCSLDEVMEIQPEDIQGGSGDKYYAGDKIRISDALVAMLLPSSNTLATAFSRYVGSKILKIK